MSHQAIAPAELIWGLPVFKHFRFILCICFILSTLLSSIQSYAGNIIDNAILLNQIIAGLRTSERAIASQTLWEQATNRLEPSTLRQLSQTTQDDLLEALSATRINRGLAQNILKLRAIALLCSQFCAISDRQDNVPGLPQATLDQLTANLPATTNADLALDNFSYNQFEIAEAFKRVILDNDHYNFRVAAGYWSQGWHQSKSVTFSLFSRSKKNRPFVVSAGQDLVLNILQNLRFRERDIQYLKSLPDFKNIPEAFFDYLREFRFSGTVRGLPVGTLAFANEPILEITSNPVEAQIVETIVIPVINAMSNFATKAARMGQASDFATPIVEGGTRRGVFGLMSAYASYLGGAAGTSNDEAARLMNIPVFGSMNHAWVMLNGSETKAFNVYNQLFPGITMLVDTYNIMRSIRLAALVVGDGLKAIRLDSTLPGKTKRETAEIVRDHLNRLGLAQTQIIYSDGLEEKDLLELKGAPINSYLIGTELAAPSDANGLGIVYKVVEDIENGMPRPDPVKLANGKAGYPGQKQIWRSYTHYSGIMAQDLVTGANETVSSQAIPLIKTLMENGQPIAAPQSAEQVRSFVRAQLQLLPAELKDLNASTNAYPVTFSEGLKQRLAAAQERLLNHNELAAVFHEVDVQKTFWQGMHGEADGPLAVSGTPAITENIARLKALAAASNEIKSIASIDYHYQVEVDSPDVNAEFHAAGDFPGFPPHAMNSRAGPVGTERIPEVENAFAANRRLVVPHQEPRGRSLSLVPFDLAPYADQITDPSYEIVIRKNGQNSYNVFENPRTEQIYKMVNPSKHIPIYVYGVATDYCVKAAVLGFIQRGYKVFVIEDAIAGVAPETTNTALEEMRAAGAIFVRTADVLARLDSSNDDHCQARLTSKR